MAGSEAKVFDCPSCGSNVTIRAVGLTVTVVCSSCQSVIDTTNENHRVLLKAQKSLAAVHHPLIELGTRGKLHGTIWEVIGFLKRRDTDSGFTWSEYLLYNPLKGFRWLTNADGHWNYVINIKGIPVESGVLGAQETAHYLDKTYLKFHVGNAKTTFALGEFYWRISAGEISSEVSRVKDYVLAPEILSSEKKENEVTWSLGEYIDAETVRKAFNIAVEMPVQLNVAPNQPSKAGAIAPDIKFLWATFGGILLLIQIFAVAFTSGSLVVTEGFTYYPNTYGSNAPLQHSTAPFELKEKIANVKVELWSPVVNSWLEIQGDLINDETGDSISFEEGVEYYQGYDSDGRWSEGSQKNSVVLSSVPAGKYHLNLEPTSAVTASTEYRVRVLRDVPIWSNFFWILTLISIYPLFVWWRARSFEVERWSQSDFSPYPSHHDDPYEDD